VPKSLCELLIHIQKMSKYARDIENKYTERNDFAKISKLARYRFENNFIKSLN